MKDEVKRENPLSCIPYDIGVITRDVLPDTRRHLPAHLFGAQLPRVEETAICHMLMFHYVAPPPTPTPRITIPASSNLRPVTSRTVEGTPTRHRRPKPISMAEYGVLSPVEALTRRYLAQSMLPGLRKKLENSGLKSHPTSLGTLLITPSCSSPVPPWVKMPVNCYPMSFPPYDRFTL